MVAPGQEALRSLGADAALAQVRLQGQVKLLSNHGAGTLSNASGQLISNNGGTLISNNGGAIISDHGAGLRILAQAPVPAKALAENPLADANIELLDAEGRLLASADGKALRVRTDAQGRYSLDAKLPQEGLVLRVRLYTGGQLLALLPRDRQAEGRLDLDTNQSLGAAYVLRRYLSGLPEGSKVSALAKLPAAEASGLAQALAQARGVPQGVPDYQPEAQEATTEALRQKDGVLATRLEGIRALLLAGVGVGDGQRARTATLSAPMGLALDPGGRLLIVESGAGRIRRLESDGTLTRVGGGNPAATNEDGQSAKSFNFDTPLALAQHPKGGHILLDRLQNRAYHLLPDGSCQVLVGTGVDGQGALPAEGRQAQIFGPGSVAVAANGDVYLGEHHKVGTAEGRLLRLDAAGQLHQVPTPPEGNWVGAQITGLAASADGALFVLATNINTGDSALWIRNPAGAWRKETPPPRTSQYATLTYDEGGQQLLVATGEGQQIHAWTASGGFRLLVGSGKEGLSPDGTLASQANLTQPGCMLVQGRRLYFSEVGAGLVRALDLSQSAPVLSTVAGSTGLVQQGQAQAIGINSPAGLAVDAEGRVFISEAASSVIKRLDGNQLSVAVGSTRGYAGDGGPGPAGRIDTPGDLAFHEGALYFLESGGFRLRQLDAQGKLRTLAGSGVHTNSFGKMRFDKPLEAAMARPLALAIAPDGTVFWSENEDHQIWRLKQGVVELVAGTANELEGEGADGPAQGNLLTSPVGLAFGPDGALYFSDTGNMRIRRILNPLGEAPQVETYAGLGRAGTLASFVGEGHGQDGPRLSTPTLAPTTLTFDAQGRLHFCEAGTARITSYATSFGLAGLKLRPIGCRIRRIEANGEIRTVAGHGTTLFSNPDAEDVLLLPLGIRFNAQGDLLVADSASNQVRLIPKALLPQ